MFCLSGFIHFAEIGEKPCAEHREQNSSFFFLIYHPAEDVTRVSVVPRKVAQLQRSLLWEVLLPSPYELDESISFPVLIFNRSDGTFCGV